MDEKLNQLRTLLDRVQSGKDYDAGLDGDVCAALLRGNDRAAVTGNMSDACVMLSILLPKWWIAHLGEIRSQIVYRDDTHQHIVGTFPWECRLQHVAGGRQTVGMAHTMPRALVAAMINVVGGRLSNMWSHPEED